MTRINLQFFNTFRDRHGRLRRYFRRPGSKSWRHLDSRAQPNLWRPIRPRWRAKRLRGWTGASRTMPGTIGALTVGYFNSLAFHNLAAKTKRTRRNILERFRVEHGDKRVVLLQRCHIERMVIAKAATPAATRNFPNTIRSLLQFAVDTGVRGDNPAIGVKRVQIKTDGIEHGTRLT